MQNNKLRFYTCDVFTDRRFGGNPLAVVLDGEGLTTEQMQLIAREFNYSETTFVLPPEQGHTNKVRIFTRTAELPFAGHPNIGTAVTLATIGALGEFDGRHQITFEEKAGLVPITIQKEADRPIWCELQAPETLSLGDPVPKERVATILSLGDNQIVTHTHQPQVASVGLPFLIIELSNRTALEHVRINLPLLEDFAAEGNRPSLFTYVRSEDEFDIRARMFAPIGGTVEDPATGSANCALAGLLTHYAPQRSGSFSWRIGQGIEMGRPSLLEARAEKEDGVVTAVYIGGHAVMISEGTLTV